MATIKLKNGSGAPLASDLVQGEPALDLTNKRLYTEDSLGAVIEVGVNPTELNVTNNITVGGTVDGRDVATDGTKLDGIEAGADVTDTANVTAAGAVMDSELTNETAVKALNQGVATTDSPTFAGLTTTADVSFGDNDKAIFGAGSDLQIYHNGSNSYIEDAGTGSLIFRASTATLFQGKTAGENQLTLVENGAVTAYYDNSAKLATTSTGINVTGTVTADDSMLVEGASGSTLTLKNTTTGAGQDALIGAVDFYNSDSSGEGPSVQARIKAVTANSIGNGADLQFYTTAASGGSEGDPPIQRMEIDQLGDISFYNDAGTSQDLYWDASNSRLGLGTTSPSYLVDAQSSGDAAIRIRSTGTGASDDSLLRMQIAGTTASNIIAFGDADSSFAGEIRYTHSNNSMIFDTNGAERMRIDSSGNVGIGTTPTNKLDLYNAGFVAAQLASDSTSETQLRFTTNTAARISNQANTALIFDTNASERMRIDSSGRLLVGTTSVGYAGVDLTVGDTADSQNGIAIQTSTTGYGYVMFGDGTGFDAFRGQITYNHGNDYMAVHTAGSERMRIDSSGNLLVGKSSSGIGTVGHELGATGYAYHTRDGGSVLDLNRKTSDGNIVKFYKDSTVVGSIGSIASDLYIAESNSGLRFDGENNQILPSSTTASTDGTCNLGAASARFKDLHLSGDAFLERVNTDHDGDWGMEMSGVSTARIRFNSSAGGSTTVGSITVSTTATAYNQSSDERLKENIVDAPSASDDIDALQVRSFDWKINGEHQKYGMVAQELNTVAPDAVTIPDDPEEMAGVDYSKLVPMLVKEIQSLRARVAQLEGAN